MELYNKDTFKKRLLKTKKIYCSNDLKRLGLKLLPVALALNHQYIQVNNDKFIQFLVIDIDHTNNLIYEQKNLPPPNFIAMNKMSWTCQYIYALKTPICKADYEKNKKALYLFALIQQEYTRLLEGDPLYVNMIAKNPLHEQWYTITPNYFYPYELWELADYITLPKKIYKRNAIGEGRNCYLFDTVRKFAYREVLFYKNNSATETDFYGVIYQKLQKLNVFNNSLPLSENELRNIAKSITKWTWKHFSCEKFSGIQMKRSHKRKITKHKNSIIGDFLNEYAAK